MFCWSNRDCLDKLGLMADNKCPDSGYGVTFDYYGQPVDPRRTIHAGALVNTCRPRPARIGPKKGK